MIYTDKFVYVHEPKTGGTFVTTMLFQLYGLKWSRWKHLQNIIFKKVQATGKYGTLIHNINKHGGCCDISSKQQNKKVLATIRNPYDLYVSQYEFGWWKRREYLKYFRQVPGFAANYPHFPDLSFAEYVYLSNAAFGVHGHNPAFTADMGLRTQDFVKFYFRNPTQTLNKLTDNYFSSGAYRTDMFDTHFIRTDSLNQDLYDFLVNHDYHPNDISFILEHGKVLPLGKGRSTEQKWEKYYTPEVKQYVRQKESVLFGLFPAFDV